ncbi:hypothetical protein DER45DRAFT_192552 [Fusarium avenaceum]|nr:hypothetical protein DER45DRAFT_192552 [Fusarium avenaceum]
MYKIQPLGYDRIEQNNMFKKNEPRLSMTRYSVSSKSSFAACPYFKHPISLNSLPSIVWSDDNESLLNLLSITHYAAGPAILDAYIYLLFVQVRRVTVIRGLCRAVSQGSLLTAHRPRQSPTEERVYRVTVSSVCTGSSRAAHQFCSIYRQKIVVFRIPTGHWVL